MHQQASPQSEKRRTTRGAIKAGEIPAALTHFDQLPESARVRLPVVAALFARSTASVWRDVKAGRLPQPQRFGRTTAWLVGDLRRALVVDTEGA